MLQGASGNHLDQRTCSENSQLQKFAQNSAQLGLNSSKDTNATTFQWNLSSI